MNKTYDLSWVLEETEFDILFNRNFTVNTENPTTYTNTEWNLPKLNIENYKQLWVITEVKYYYTTNRPGHFGVHPNYPQLNSFSCGVGLGGVDAHTGFTMYPNETITTDNKWSNLLHEVDSTINPGGTEPTTIILKGKATCEITNP